MKTSSIVRPLALIAALAFAGATSAFAEEPANTIKFSDPAKPGTLKIVVARGDIRVAGGDVTEVSVKTEMQPQQQQHPRKDGLRVLTDAASYSLTEKDNVITLDAGSQGWMGGDADFAITVPRNTNVVIANSFGGDINCGGVNGDIEIKSLHGEVQLTDVTGSAVVDTMNGEINASIRELHEGKALSFTSMNGEVELRVPATAKANVHLRTQNGTILTDFDEKTLVTKVENMGGVGNVRGDRARLSAEMRQAFREAARASKIAGEQVAAAMKEAAEAARQGLDDDDDDAKAPKTPRHAEHAVPPIPPVPPVPPVLPPIPPISGGKLVSGTLNGGGPEINVTTMNGDVKLRHLESK